MSADKNKTKTSSVKKAQSKSGKKVKSSVKKGGSSLEKKTYRSASNVSSASSSKKRPEAGKSVKNSSGHEGMPKSATVLAIERQQKLEKMSPIGQFTAELPSLGRSLDGPDRRPWKNVKMPRLKGIKFEWDTRKNIKLGIFFGIILAIMIAVLIIVSKYTVDTVIIEGNVHYSNDEIYNMVIGDRKIGTNSIYLSMKYKNKEIEDIPFIQTMSVNIVDSKTIKITVYEKALAGYVEYLERYFYFDKDGTVVESTNIKTTGIPQVLGLDFDHIVMYEKLPLENDEIFGQILEMTQLLEKYEIEMDKIYFDKNYDMTLYFGDARIRVGDFNYIDEKIIKLKSILPELEGKSGVLRLDNYKGADGVITFEKDS